MQGLDITFPSKPKKKKMTDQLIEDHWNSIQAPQI